MCLPWSRGQNLCRASSTANNLRQLMCQHIRGPVQGPETACQLHTVPQLVLDASHFFITRLDTCSMGTSANRNAKFVQRLQCSDRLALWSCDVQGGFSAYSQWHVECLFTFSVECCYGIVFIFLFWRHMIFLSALMPQVRLILAATRTKGFITGFEK